MALPPAPSESFRLPRWGLDIFKSRLSPGYQLLLEIALSNQHWILLTIILGFFSGLFNGVSVALVVPAILSFVGQEVGGSQAPAVVRKMLALFDGVPADRRFMVTIAAIAVAILVKNALQLLSTAVGGHLSRRLVNEAMFRGLRLVLDVGIDFYNRVKAGDLIQRLGSEMSGAVGTINTLVQLTATSVTITAFMVILVSISWQLTLAAAFFAGLVVLCNRYFSITSRTLGRRAMLLGRQYTSALVELLAGIRLVKATSNEDAEFERLTGLILQKQRVELQSQTFKALVNSTNEVLSLVALLSIVGIGRLVFANQLELFAAILLTYLFLLSRVLAQVTTLGKSVNNLALCSACVEGMVMFLDRSNKHAVPNGIHSFQGLERGITFEKVSFHYPSNRKNSVLKGINLHLPKGTTLALVGSSGAGKSTLADLLVRFYDPSKGRITLDGRDLRDFDLRSLHRRMGIVSQDTFLFNDTVRNNIAYACPGASDAAIEDAAERANASEFVRELPEGFDTLLGDRGVRLSGGQKQRIAIARALLRNPDILILDEATSALDTVSERMVQQAIAELSRDRTSLVIAHRLSTVQNAHQIAVLERGEVVETGTHEELLERGGAYAKLYAIQFSDADANVAIHHKNALEDLVLKEAIAQIDALKDERERAAALQETSRNGSGEGSRPLPDASSVVAYALNRLPAFYATTEEGVRYQRHRAETELGEEIAAQVAAAIARTESNPDFVTDRRELPAAVTGVSPSAHTLAVVGRVSYEIRARLNVMLGSLRLLVDGLVDDEREQRELVREAYRSSVQILTTLSFLEDTLALQSSLNRTAFESVDGDGSRSYRSALETATKKVQFLLQRMNGSLELLANDLVDDLMDLSGDRAHRRQQRYREVYDTALEILNRMESIEAVDTGDRGLSVIR